MNELRMIENELVPVYETSTGEKVVYGTELYECLGSKRQYTDWIKVRLKECDAVENEDFQSFSQNNEKPTGGRPKLEYIIKLDTAKEMAMLERNEKGKQVRRYFINVEKKYNEIKRKQFEEQDIFTQVFGKTRFSGANYRSEQEMFASWSSPRLLPPPRETWYDRNKMKIKGICGYYGWDRKFLYHKILTELKTRYDLERAKRIYIAENGFAPYYAMDIVEHFPELQDVADKYIDYLLEG